MKIEELKYKLSNALSVEQLNAMAFKCGALVEARAKARCPVQTGILKASIRTDVENGEATVGTNLEYAMYVEHGTGLFANDGEGRPSTDAHPIPWRYKTPDGKWHTTSGQQAQPFLIPALYESRDDIARIIAKGIKESID